MSRDSTERTDSEPNAAPPEPAATDESVEIFISYSRKDKRACRALVKHLSLLRRQNLIKDWHDGMLLPGDDWDHIIYQKMQTAHIVILLLSKNFIASDFCWSKELKQARERHARGETRIVPILLSPCDLEKTDFMKLQVLPTNAVPITLWKDRDEAWADVVSRLRAVVEVTQQTLVQRSPEQRKARATTGQDAEIHTVLSRYSKLGSWLSDLHDFFGTVAGAGGFRRVLRTFSTLTFNFDSLIAFILSSADTEENRRRYIGPPVCVIYFLAAFMGMVFLMQSFGLGAGLFVRDIPRMLGLFIFGLFYFGLVLRMIAKQKRPFGELLAIGCYIGGSVGLPSFLFLGLIFAMMLLAKIFVTFSGMPIYLAIIAVAGVAFVASIPLILTRGLRRFTGKVGGLRVLGFTMSVICFALITLATTQPGHTVLIGSIICQTTNRPSCAEKLSKLSIKLQPQSENVWITRIGLLIIHEELAEARQLAEQATNLHPRAAYLHYLLGKTLFHSDPARAEDEFKLALAINPILQDAAAELGTLYMTQGKNEKLIEHCKMVIGTEQFPEQQKYLCRQQAGIALVRLKKFDEALGYLKQVLTTEIQVDDHSSQARTLNLIGRTYSGLGDEQQAVSHFERAVAISSRLGDSHNEAVALDNLAISLSQLRRPMDAIARYREAATAHFARRPPDTVDALTSLDAAFKLGLRHKLWPQAEAALSELEAQDPPAYRRVQWRAQLSGYMGAADTAGRYAELMRLAAALPPATQTKTQAIALAGGQRARAGARWPDCPGVVVIEVRKDSQAARLGVAVGDIVLTYEGQCIHDDADLVTATGKTGLAQEVTIDGWHADHPRSLTAQGGLLGIIITTF